MSNWSEWAANWPEPATYYLDPVNGDDSHAGTAPATAWKTYAKAESTALTPGQSVAKRVDGQWIRFKTASRVPQRGVVLGYYQQSFSPMPLADLDFGAVTHIAHDHVEPNADGSLNLTYLDMTAANSAALLTAAHAANVKVFLTFADVGTAHFTEAATNHLQTLAHNIVQLATARGYDGIDIDWERAVTQPALSNFMSVLYPAAKAINPNLLVHMAVSYTNENGGLLDTMWAQTVAFTDYMTAMCYDMYPAGQCFTWFDAPLFDANIFGGPFNAPMQSAWKHIRSLVLNGVPPAKILHGIPFYGRLFTGNVGTPTGGPLAPRQSYPSAGAMTNTYTPYNTIPPLYLPADEHWDDISQTPFLSIVNADPTLNSYLTYDDPSSLTSKIDWTIARNLGGLAIWELSLDYFSGRTIKSPLLNAVRCAYPKAPLPIAATPAASASLTSQAVSASSATLNWASVAAAATYNVKRSTTNGSGYSTIAAVSGTAFTDTTIASGTTYYYVVTAVNAQVEGPNSPQVTVVASASSPPAAPTALAASSVTPTSVINHLQTTLTWSGSAALYLVKRSTQITGGPYTVVASATTPTYTDVSLAPNQSYYYVVSAVASGLESANTAQVVVAAPDYVATNLLGSPADISVAPWLVGGIGTVVLNATQLQGATSGVTSLLQAAVPVDPNTNYVATITVASALVSGFVTLSVYAPGWTPIPASQGQWVQAGIPASFTVPFNTSGNATVIYELDLNDQMVGATVTISNARLSVRLPGSTNLLPSPNAINVSPWGVSGTGAAATGPMTLQCASSGVTSLAQQSVPVTPGTNYTALLTISSSVASGFAALNLYASGYSFTIANAGLSLLTTQVTLTVNFNSGSQTAVIFELDVDASAAGHVLTLSGASLAVTPDSVQQW